MSLLVDQFAVPQMLFRAHPCRKAVDPYDVAAPVLRTVTKDENSHRYRGVKPRTFGATREGALQVLVRE